MMNRLQKKCFIAATAFHGLLVLILLFGSALMPNPEESSFKPIKVYSAASVSDALSSGGNPDAEAAPAPLPTPPQPKPPTETLPTPPAPKPEPKRETPTPKPEPKPEPPKIVHNALPKPPTEKLRKEKPKPEPKEVETPKTPHRIVIPKDELRATMRKVDANANAQQEAADASARAASKRAAREFASALKTISKNLSSKTPLVEMPPGPGGGGEISVNYGDLIASKYYNAWIAPAGLDDDTPVVTASVTISRNGDVISAHITKSSGNALMDRSIQHVLEAVTFIEPFPASSHEQQRTVTIQFNLQAKRQIG